MNQAKAKVFDIRNINIDSLNKGIYAVDTNVLYWMHYSRCYGAPYQLSIYPDFIAGLLDKGCTLVTTIYNITELLNLIEKQEYEIFKLHNQNITKKQFRYLEQERLNVKKELDSVYSQIKTIYQIKEFNVNINQVNEFVNNFDKHKCDNFDYIIIKFLIQNGINNIIGDDYDFLSMENINIFTANRKACRI